MSPKWVGPVRCIHRDGKQTAVAMGNEGPVPFNIVQAKPAPIDCPTPEHSTQHNSQFVFITEVIKLGDPRETKFGPAIQKEILGLI
jgi:hypothetical protein